MFRLRLVFALLAAALALGLAACGGTTHKVKSPPTASSSLCPVGHASMGCAVPRPHGLTAPAPVKITGPIFPDVSSYQGHPNWALAKPHISMAVAKAWEFRTDADFFWNVSQFKALHIAWSAYDFVRYCDASGFIGALRAVGGPNLPPVLDMEVPAAAGCAPKLANQVWLAFHVWPIIYTGPGTWAGGSSAGLKLWIADYGPSFPCMWTCHPVAWQFTDGRYNRPVYIPGIGSDDVSVDFGFSSLLPGPPPDLHHYARFAPGKFSSPFGTLVERRVVLAYDGARQHPAKYAGYLRRLEVELRYLAARDSYIARTQRVNGNPSWGLYHRGWRYQQLLRRAQGHKVA